MPQESDCWLACLVGWLVGWLIGIYWLGGGRVRIGAANPRVGEFLSQVPGLSFLSKKKARKLSVLLEILH